MNYLYHWVPKDMKGEILYPLNVLKEKYPELYVLKSAKYTGRGELLEQVVPVLDCLWNDVIHLSAVHPKIVREALVEAGSKKDFKMTCYQIDPHLLDSEKTIVYLYSHSDDFEIKNEDFVKFDPNKIGEYSSLPQDTKDYYKEMFDKNIKPLVFHRVVHILYKGELNVKDFPVVEF